MSAPYALITGGAGMLALALRESLEQARLPFVALGRDQLDVTDAEAVHRTITGLRPKVVLQCAAYTRVDDAEKDEARAFAVNATAVEHVAAACRTIHARLIYPSTDYVFDGRASQPYEPDHPTSPINAYGRSKLAGETAARAAGDYRVIRTSWLYGRGGKNFVRTVADRMRAGAALRVVSDQTGSPTWTVDLARMIVEHLPSNDPSGVYHWTNAGQTTWYGLAIEIRRLLGLHVDVTPCRSEEYPTPARRPSYSVLAPAGGAARDGGMRDWRAALQDALATSHF